jgi:hypothetical protein
LDARLVEFDAFSHRSRLLSTVQQAGGGPNIQASAALDVLENPVAVVFELGSEYSHCGAFLAKFNMIIAAAELRNFRGGRMRIAAVLAALDAVREAIFLYF